ncbi:hypothetical protein [Providencia hangzhouensis]|uniref:hypothetical protein n=1 Tax=Providencia hangzhouensis TaxID=3031799 RepID=UPI0034DDC67F
MHHTDFELKFANANEQQFHAALKQASQEYLQTKQITYFASRYQSYCNCYLVYFCSSELPCQHS